MLQESYFGQSGIDFLSSWVSEHHIHSALIVTGEAFYEVCGAKTALDRALNGVRTSFFTDFTENPKWTDVQNGLERLKQTPAEAVIAVGGGSVLDMAKLVRFFHSYRGNPTGRNFQKETALLPLFALPTTAGTGAEATRFAVCYVDGTKYSVEHEDLQPDYAIVQSSFTYGAPQYLTACTAFDALAQSIESYWSVGSTEESEEYSLKALRLLWPNIQQVVEAPLPQHRDAVSQGAYWAGRAINIAKTTAPHAFSYPFTSHCGYPHGHAVALTFPFFFGLNLKAKVSDIQETIDYKHYSCKMQALRECMGIRDGEERSAMVCLLKRMGMHSHGFEGHSVHDLLSKVNLQRLNNNPVRVTDSIISDLELFLQQ